MAQQWHLFTISCPHWFDQDDIKDYSLYRLFLFLTNQNLHHHQCLLWLVSSSNRLIIAFSSVSTFDVYLPSGISPRFDLQLMVSIRDRRDCISQWNLTTVIVQTDSTILNDFLNQLTVSSNGSTNNPMTRLLSYGNQNPVGQMIISISQYLNRKNEENIQNASSSISFISSIFNSSHNTF